MDNPLHTLPLPSLSTTDGEVPVSINDISIDLENEQQQASDQPVIVEYPYYSSCTKIQDCWNRTERKEFIKTALIVIGFIVATIVYIILIVVAGALMAGKFDSDDQELNSFKAVIGLVLMISLLASPILLMGTISPRKPSAHDGGDNVEVTHVDDNGANVQPETL